MEHISLRPRRIVWHALISESSAKQIAWGVALGVLIGFVPKGNLIAICLAGILFSMRVNLLSALVAVIACSLVAPLFDPFFDHMGRTILTIVPLQGLFARVYQWPFVPWTAFNNTVVMGALFVGLLQLYPTYRITRRLARGEGSVWDTLERQQDRRLIVGAETN